MARPKKNPEKVEFKPLPPLYVGEVMEPPKPVVMDSDSRAFFRWCLTESEDEPESDLRNVSRLYGSK